MSKLKDETGNRYSYLTVIQRVSNRNNKVYWQCLCDCGRTTFVSGTNLRTGQVKSCGYCVNNSHKQNLIGQKFGVLEVIEEVPNRKKTSWKCKCIYCGRERIVDGTNLKEGHTKSCTCIQGSTGEKIISSILQEYNIPYQSQYVFDDFKLSTGGTPKFDFAIFTLKGKLLALIEYDGEQHFISTGGWNNSSCHNLTKQRDEEKNQYCFEHHIPLIRIPYTDLNKINILYILMKIKNVIKEVENV